MAKHHVGDLLGYTTGNRFGEPVWCVGCAVERFPESSMHEAVRRDEEGREVYAVLQEERPFERVEGCAECGAAVIDAERPLPRQPEPERWVI